MVCPSEVAAELDTKPRCMSAVSDNVDGVFRWNSSNMMKGAGTSGRPPVFPNLCNPNPNPLMVNSAV